MFDDWYKIDKIQTVMPEFNYYSIKFIEKLVFFVGYNEDYDEVAKLEIIFKVFKDKEEYSLVMLFEDVSSLNLEDFCKHQQVGIFQLEDMSLRGYES